MLLSGNDSWNSTYSDIAYENWGFDDNTIERTLADAIYIYISPILLLLGIMGNLLSIPVLLGLSQRTLSSCVYLAILSALDLVILLIRCGNDWLSHALQLDLTNMLMVSSHTICQVYPFLFNFLFHLSKWLMICLVIEGYIAIKHPQRAVTMCSLSRAKAIVMLLMVLLTCVNIHFFWSFKLDQPKDSDQQNGFYCTFVQHGSQYSEAFQEVIWPILDLLMSELLPHTIIISCGAVMLQQIIKGKHKGDKAHQQWRKRYQMNPAAIDELKISILVVCVCYVILTIPKFLYLVFRYVIENHVLIEYSYKFEAQQLLGNAVCSMLEYCFYSAKFLIYFSTSRMYREDYSRQFKRLLCYCCEQTKQELKTNHHLNSGEHVPVHSSRMRRESKRPQTWTHEDMNVVYDQQCDLIPNNFTTV